MSCQKGNVNRKRPQKHQNQFSFKNDLHDTSHTRKFINNIDIVNVCERCKKILEWKIKYKKYKPLKAPGKCTKCDQKTVKHAYHIMCLQCARNHAVCPKCGQAAPIVESKPDREESIKLDAELQALIKSLPERKRRTFIRYMNRTSQNKSKNSKNSKEADKDNDTKESPASEPDDDEQPVTRESLIEKLKSLKLKDGKNSNADSDLDDEDDDLDDFL